jgi:hypothetical protein
LREWKYAPLIPTSQPLTKGEAIAKTSEGVNAKSNADGIAVPPLEKVLRRVWWRASMVRTVKENSVGHEGGTTEVGGYTDILDDTCGRCHGCDVCEHGVEVEGAACMGVSPSELSADWI